MRAFARTLATAVLLGSFASIASAEEPLQPGADWEIVYPRFVADPSLHSGFAPLTETRDLALGRFGFNDDTRQAGLFGGLRGRWDSLSLEGGALYRLDRERRFDDDEGLGVGLAVKYDFDILSARAGMTYLPEDGDKRDGIYYPSFGLNVPLGGFATLSGHFGIQQNDTTGGPASFDYSIGATADIDGFDVEVKWAETDDTTSGCADRCGAVYFSVKKSF